MFKPKVLLVTVAAMFILAGTEAQAATAAGNSPASVNSHSNSSDSYGGSLDIQVSTRASRAGEWMPLGPLPISSAEPLPGDALSSIATFVATLDALTPKVTEPVPVAQPVPAAKPVAAAQPKVAESAPVVVSTPSSDGSLAADLARLRQCESGGNYADDTGNGYYGAYQFSASTWQGMGLTGLPSEASPAAQDEAATRLHAARGWQPWPACSRKLGL